MTYQEFIEQVKEKAHSELSYELDLMEFLPEGYTSDDQKELEEIRFANKRFVGVEADCLLTDFLLLKKKDEKSGVTHIQRLAIRKMYEGMKEEGFDAVFDEVRKSLEDIEKTGVQEAISRRSAAAVYDDIREQLILRPLNYKLHIHELKNCAYRKIGDFVLVLYQLLGNADFALATSKIRRDELERWGMGDRMEEVMRDALENTARLFPPSVYNKTLQKEVNFLTEDFTKEDIVYENSNMILLSTKTTTNGAVALFYPGVIEKMMGIMGGSFTAVFMNINDVMILSRNDPRAAPCVEQAKHSSQMGEMLSGRIYLCNEKGVNPA